MLGAEWPKLCRPRMDFSQLRMLAVMFVLATVVSFKTAKLVSASDKQSNLSDTIQLEILKRSDGKLGHNTVHNSGQSFQTSSSGCIHGYFSAADKATCVCNYGWVGPACAENALPTCIRYTISSLQR